MGVNNLNPAYHLDVSGTFNVTSTLNIRGIPLLPVLTVGVWLWDSGNAAYPIYGTISDLASWDMNDRDNFWVVLPGYAVQVYQDANFGSSNFICDNTLGSFVRRYVTSNAFGQTDNASSCRVFYRGVEVAELVTVSNVSYGGVFT